MGNDLTIDLSIADLAVDVDPALSHGLAEAITDPAFSFRYATHGGASLIGLADWYGRRWRIHVRTEEILELPVGPKAALRLLLETLKTRYSKVVIPVPAYSGFRKVAQAAGYQVIDFPLNDSPSARLSIDIDALRSLLDAETILFWCNPHNPTGRVWESDIVAEIVDLVRSTGAFLLGDEVHADLVYDGATHTSLAGFDLVDFAVVHGFGKAFNVSGVPHSIALIRSEQLLAEVRHVVAAWGVYPSQFWPDVLVQVCLSVGDEWLNKLVPKLETDARRAVSALNSAGEFFQSHLPEAGMLAWVTSVDMDGIAGEDIAGYLRERADVVVLGGTRFDPGRGHNKFRINVSGPDGKVEEAITRMVGAVMEDRPRL